MISADLIRFAALASVPISAWAGMLSYGQLCVVAVVQTAAQWFPGDPLDPDTRMGPIVDERSLTRVLTQPLARFHRTFDIVFALVFGTLSQALGAARRLHRRHSAVTGVLPAAIGPFALTTAEGAAAKVEWVSTVRSRLGFAFDRVLVYGTGGVARTHVGWTAGGGIEAAITSNLSAKVEYLYTDLGREHHEAPALVTGTPTVAGLIPSRATRSLATDV